MMQTAFSDGRAINDAPLTAAAERRDHAREDADDLALRCAEFDGQMKAIQGELDEAQARLDQANLDGEELHQTLAILQGLEAAWKRAFEETLADVVSRGLTLVFSEPMQVEILSEISRGVSAVEFKLTTGRGEDKLTTDIMGARGGSYVEVASFLFRIFLILSSRPALRRVVLIDESFSMVADHNIPALAQMIRRFVDRLGIQVILDTHAPAFADVADVVHEVTLDPKARIPTTRVLQIKDRNEAHA